MIKTISRLRKALAVGLYAILLLFHSNLNADTLTPTTLIDNGGNPMGAPPYSSYNSQTHQFFVGWTSGFIYYSLYNLDGTRSSGPTLLVDSSGPVNPFTLPVSCYNSTNNEFLISYLGQNGDTYAWFNLLDQSGHSIAGPISIENHGGDSANSLVFCAYDKVENRYLLTWASIGSVGYFAVLDASGNVVVPATEISGSSVDANAGYNVHVSYNSTDHQYFFTWQGAVDGKPYFAIYRADGTLDTAATLIPSGDGINSPILSNTYNSTDNQYLVTWNDNNGIGYLAIYDAAGTPVLAATPFTDSVSTFNFGSVLASYNSRNNEYFLTWEGVDGNSQYAIYDASGAVSVAPTTIPNLNGVNNFGFVTNAYGIDANAFLIAWIGPEFIQDGYSAVYSRNPPPVNPPSEFSATPRESTVDLMWTNPGDPNFATVTIRRSTTDYPSTATDGIAVLNDSTGSDYADAGLPNGVYYYSLFATDGFGNYSSAVHATATVDAAPPTNPPSVNGGGCDLGASRSPSSFTAHFIAIGILGLGFFELRSKRHKVI